MACPSSRRTARQKLDIILPSHGKAFQIPNKMQRALGVGTMIVPRPLDVEATMRKPRLGQLITMSQIRTRLARRAGVDKCCPITTGIFARLSAEAAEDDAIAAGLRGVPPPATDGAQVVPRIKPSRITPWWRTIRDDGRLIDKFPGGGKAQAAQLRGEGYTIVPGIGKQMPKVQDYEKFLMRIPRS
jgi:alkylated DNA nucleotide flippase Atl1